MRAVATVLAALLLVAAAEAREVGFPLVVDHALLRATLAAQLGEESDGSAVMWGARGGCRSLVLRDLRVGPAAGRLRVTARGAARLGFRFLGFCFAPLSWKGTVESSARPELGQDWRLRLRDVESNVYDAAGRRAVVASWLWDVIRDHFERDLAVFTFDLAPPLEEVKELVRASAAPAQARPVLDALATLRAGDVEVDDRGVEVRVALDVAEGDVPPPATEPLLAPEELARWQERLESWDGFLVFVVKDLGVVDADPRVRDQLFDVLLAGRQRLLDALVSGPATGIDPMRQLFLDTWERLRGVVRESATHGGTQDRLLRYVSFVAAGDALAALDAALGLEVSSDGLRRLARVLEPAYAGDPLAYTEAPDPTLRELFDFHEPAPGDGPPEPPPGESGWLGPPAAWAGSPADGTGGSVRRLDRWVPSREDLPEYRDAVGVLLARVAERTAGANAVEQRFVGLYAALVPAVAWQESCWRQFVQRDGQVTYLLSRTGDVGLMQVNRRVWRGFFDLSKLEWDIDYNAGAGAEILAHFLTRYGAREAGERLENAARATYAAYNGGPDAYRRYRLQRVPHAQRAIDRAFWEKYQAMAAGRALDFVLCVERWGLPAPERLSSVPTPSMPKCSIRSRSSAAIAWISRRHASIASRPRASLV